LLFSPVVLGIIYMAAYGAPQIYTVSNASAGIAILVGILFVPRARHLQLPAISPIVVATVILAFFAATFAGPSVGGVHRWIGLGPIKLHAGMLLLPTLLGILAGLNARLACEVILVAAALFALQPDFASALALCVSTLACFILTQNRWAFIALLGTCVALAVTLLRTDELAPVSFVEAVVQDAFARHPLISIGMILSVAMAAAAPILSLSIRTAASAARLLGWSACLIGYFLASLIGDYPTPLLGYGVSPIFGFGCACILVLWREDADNRVSPSSLDRV
jgi:cell division protein FtsW (lipid II flippase)